MHIPWSLSCARRFGEEDREGVVCAGSEGDNTGVVVHRFFRVGLPPGRLHILIGIS